MLTKQGKTAAKTESVDIESLADQCWTEIPPEATNSVVNSSASISGDRGRLRHVSENLLRNAVEHNDDPAIIGVGLTEKLQLSARGSESDAYEGSCIEDDGSGIPDSDRVDVFSMGYSTGGTGLGLPIAEDIIEAHGWSISVTETEKGGARFNISGVDFAEPSRDVGKPRLKARSDDVATGSLTSQRAVAAETNDCFPFGDNSMLPCSVLLIRRAEGLR